MSQSQLEAARGIETGKEVEREGNREIRERGSRPHGAPEVPGTAIHRTRDPRKRRHVESVRILEFQTWKIPGGQLHLQKKKLVSEEKTKENEKAEGQCPGFRSHRKAVNGSSLAQLRKPQSCLLPIW